MTRTRGAARPASSQRVEAVQLLGIAGASVAWLGWFQVAPALGFPTIGPAAMLNRIFVPKSDPGVWVGWVLVGVGLVSVAALYALAAARGWLRPGPVSGLLLGLAAWAVGGMVVMVIVGHISPLAPAPQAPPGPPLPTTPDPMHATFMMLHLGALAPVEALLAWLLLGGVVGATSVPTEAAVHPHFQAKLGPTTAFLALGVALSLGVWISLPRALGATGSAAEVEPRLLATGSVKGLPEGAVFMSVIELPQATGATLGPHGHVPGFAYVLRGRETIPFSGASTMQLDAGDGGFMGALTIHSHQNRKDRLPAALLAVGLLVLGLILLLLSRIKIAARLAVVATLTSLLIVAGAVALWNPWANDWYFISVRPAGARGGVMPLPNAARIYESPDLESLPPGPYKETLGSITVPAGEVATVEHEPGAEMFLVLEGRAEVRLNGGSPTSLGPSRAVLVQQGMSVEVSNPGGQELNLLTFSVVASGGSP